MSGQNGAGAMWVWCWRRRGAWRVSIRCPVGAAARAQGSGDGDRRDERRRADLGVSGGNWHRPVEEALDDGVRFWRELRFGDVLAPLVAPGGAARFIHYAGEFLSVSSLHAASILDPEPLAGTLEKLVDFDQLVENIRWAAAGALGLVATPAHGNRSVVFHQGGIPRHREDPLRGIEYVATPKLVQYSLLHRKPETNGVLDACREMDVAVVVCRPIGGGAVSAGSPTGSGRPALADTLREVAEGHSATATRVALA